MLSNTDEMKPRVKADCQEAGGSFSTGIIEAQVTRASRKIEPLRASGIRLHSGFLTGMAASSTTHTATPRKGKWSAASANFRLTVTLVATAPTRMAPTTPTRAQSMWCAAWMLRRIGWCRCCCRAAGKPNTSSATAAAT